MKQASDTDYVRAVAALPGGRFVSCSDDHLVKIWTLAGDLEHTFNLEDWVLSVAVLPDGAHLVVGLGCGEIVLLNQNEQPESKTAAAEARARQEVLLQDRKIDERASVERLWSTRSVQGHHHGLR